MAGQDVHHKLLGWHPNNNDVKPIGMGEALTMDWRLQNTIVVVYRMWCTVQCQWVWIWMWICYGVDILLCSGRRGAEIEVVP